jgi:hypothetical protein
MRGGKEGKTAAVAADVMSLLPDNLPPQAPVNWFDGRPRLVITPATTPDTSDISTWHHRQEQTSADIINKNRHHPTSAGISNEGRHHPTSTDVIDKSRHQR